MADDEANFFDSPPAGDDAPIVLGPPADDPFGGGDFGGGGGDFGGGDFVGGDYGAADNTFGDFSAPPVDDQHAAYLGDVNESPGGDAPIILGGPPPDAPPPEPPVDEMPEESNEPSPMQKWNAEWQETLKNRKDEENSRKAEMIEEARVALEQFQAEREQRRESVMAKNREDEQAKLEAIEADLENDNSWQRVCKMVELSHDNSSDAKDVKRMRDTLIFLKNEPTKATALST